MAKLLILGAGEYSTVIKEIAEEFGYFQSIDFLDDSYCSENPKYHENSIGKISDMDKLAKDYEYGIVAIGNPEVRLNLTEKLESLGYRIPILVSLRSFVSKSAHLEKGVVIEPLATVHSNSFIGTASYISSGAVVNHNAIVSSGCHIDNNSVVMSGAIVKEKITTKPCEVVSR